ncbi:MAG: hypothetical protein GTO60_14645 [Gammaproteobacteria bacterium]|nr:hypothetical protein [Gammaproteobacteria bacterium]
MPPVESFESRALQEKKGMLMGRKPNYGYEKRQKELARKAKKEEKKKRKLPENEDNEPEDNQVD